MPGLMEADLARSITNYSVTINLELLPGRLAALRSSLASGFNLEDVPVAFLSAGLERMQQETQNEI